MKSTKNNHSRPLPKSLAGFEIESAVARMLNKPELWWCALGIFHNHYSHWKETWHASQAARETERKCVHALRSSAANVGAERLAAATAALENALLNQDVLPETLAILRAHLLACFVEVRQSTESVLD